MDFDELVEKKTMLGSAGVIVMDETVDMVQACLNIARFYAHESCGQCTPCREGTAWLVKMLTRLVNGGGTPKDIDMIFEITDNIGGLIDFSKGSFGKTICPFGEAVAWPVRSFVEKFETEFQRDAYALRLKFEKGHSDSELEYMLDVTTPRTLVSKIERAKSRFQMFLEQTGYSQEEVMSIMQRFWEEETNE